jgi:hypothetical protein
MLKNHGPQIKDDKEYETLRRQGASADRQYRPQDRATRWRSGRAELSRPPAAMTASLGPAIPA